MSTRTNWEPVGSHEGKVWWRTQRNDGCILVVGGAGHKWQWAVLDSIEPGHEHVLEEGETRTPRSARRACERAYARTTKGE